MCPNCNKVSLKKTAIIVLVSVLVVFLNTKEVKASEGHQHHKMGDSTKKEKPRKVISEIDKKSVIAILVKNEILHDSFFEYNKDQIEKSAKALSVEIDKIKNTEISNLLKYSQKKLNEIKKSNTREQNNELYNVVSTALIYLVNTYELGSKYNAYSCPMVKKKWIQNSSKVSKVKNPYAPEMPHCGSQDTSY